MAYDERDFMVAITYPDGKGFDFEYDDSGRRTRRTDRDGYVLEYLYDDAGRLERVSDGTGRELVRYWFDPAGRVSAEAKGNGTRSTFERDPVGRIARVVHFAPDDSVSSWLEYTYDAAGRPISIERQEGVTIFGHDLAWQLFSVVHSDEREVQYTYDPAGNRLAMNDGGVVTPYAVDAMNRCTVAGTVSLGYDADGNLVSRTGPEGTTTYAYDAENRLVLVHSPGGETWEYGYNALGQLDSVTHDGATTRYLLDPGGLVDVAAEYDDDGSLVARYVHGLGLAARVDPDGNLAGFNFDALGSTVEVTGPDGGVANSYFYDPFGGMLSTVETIPNPFRFVGRQGVMAEPTGLLNMRARRYDPGLGRFTSEDPIGSRGASTCTPTWETARSSWQIRRVHSRTTAAPLRPPVPPSARVAACAGRTGATSCAISIARQTAGTGINASSIEPSISTTIH